MAKTKTTKKQSRVVQRTNWLRNASPAKRSALFVLAFTFIGGSFVIKSFAATPNTIYPDKFTYSNGAKLGTDSSGKSPIAIGRLTRITDNPNSPPTIWVNFPVNFSKPTSKTVCITARGQVSKTYPRDPTFYATGNDNLHYFSIVPQSTTYKDYCTDVTVAAGAHTLQVLWNKLYETEGGNDTTSSEIYIAKAFIK